MYMQTSGSKTQPKPNNPKMDSGLVDSLPLKQLNHNIESFYRDVSSTSLLHPGSSDPVSSTKSNIDIMSGESPDNGNNFANSECHRRYQDTTTTGNCSTNLIDDSLPIIIAGVQIPKRPFQLDTFRSNLNSELHSPIDECDSNPLDISSSSRTCSRLSIFSLESTAKPNRSFLEENNAYIMPSLPYEALSSLEATTKPLKPNGSASPPKQLHASKENAKLQNDELAASKNSSYTSKSLSTGVKKSSAEGDSGPDLSSDDSEFLKYNNFYQCDKDEGPTLSGCFEKSSPQSPKFPYRKAPGKRNESETDDRISSSAVDVDVEAKIKHVAAQIDMLTSLLNSLKDEKQKNLSPPDHTSVSALFVSAMSELTEISPTGASGLLFGLELSSKPPGQRFSAPQQAQKIPSPFNNHPKELFGIQRSSPKRDSESAGKEENLDYCELVKQETEDSACNESECYEREVSVQTPPRPYSEEISYKRLWTAESDDLANEIRTEGSSSSVLLQANSSCPKRCCSKDIKSKLSVMAEDKSGTQRLPNDILFDGPSLCQADLYKDVEGEEEEWEYVIDCDDSHAADKKKFDQLRLQKHSFQLWGTPAVQSHQQQTPNNVRTSKGIHAKKRGSTAKKRASKMQAGKGRGKSAEDYFRLISNTLMEINKNLIKNMRKDNPSALATGDPFLVDQNPERLSLGRDEKSGSINYCQICPVNRLDTAMSKSKKSIEKSFKFGNKSEDGNENSQNVLQAGLLNDPNRLGSFNEFSQSHEDLFTSGDINVIEEEGSNSFSTGTNSRNNSIDERHRKTIEQKSEKERSALDKLFSKSNKVLWENLTVNCVEKSSDKENNTSCKNLSPNIEKETWSRQRGVRSDITSEDEGSSDCSSAGSYEHKPKNSIFAARNISKKSSMSGSSFSLSTESFEKCTRHNKFRDGKSQHSPWTPRALKLKEAKQKWENNRLARIKASGGNVKHEASSPPANLRYANFMLARRMTMRVNRQGEQLIQNSQRKVNPHSSPGSASSFFPSCHGTDWFYSLFRTKANS